MEAIVLSKEDYQEIKTELMEIKTHVKKISVPNESFIDNKEFVNLMGISFKTAQTWRNEGKIGFSQEGKKIYYRLSDIEAFLDTFHKKPFANKDQLARLRGY